MTSEERLARRREMLERSAELERANAARKVTITPSMLSFYSLIPEADGAIGRYVFTLNGKIIRAVVHIDKVPKTGSDVHIAIAKTIREMSSGFHIREHDDIVPLDIPITSGDRLIVRVPTPEVSGIWVGLIFIKSRNEMMEVLENAAT